MDISGIQNPYGSYGTYGTGSGDRATKQTEKEQVQSAGEQFAGLFSQYKDQVIDKIENGDTEPTYQIGAGTYTDKEWDKLIQKIDKDLDNIKEEQKERADKLKEEAQDPTKYFNRKSDEVQQMIEEEKNEFSSAY